MRNITTICLSSVPQSALIERHTQQCDSAPQFSGGLLGFVFLVRHKPSERSHFRLDTALPKTHWRLNTSFDELVITDIVTNFVGPTPAAGILAFKRAQGRSSGGPEDKLRQTRRRKPPRQTRRHKPPKRQFTCHLLFLPPDTSLDSQSRLQPRQSSMTNVCEQLGACMLPTLLAGFVLHDTFPHKLYNTGIQWTRFKAISLLR